MKICAGRHHVWNVAGTACKKCNAPKGKPGRPPGARAKPKAGEAVAGRLAATLGVAAPPPSLDGSVPPARQETASGGADPLTAAPPTPQASTSPPAAAPSAPLPPATPGWCKSAGKRLAKLFEATVDFALEKMRREANEPDDDDVDDFGEAMGAQLAIWFPDTAMTPAKQLMLSGSFIVGGMCIGSKKLPPEPPKLLGVKNGTTDAAAASTAARAAPSTSGETPPRAS